MQIYVTMCHSIFVSMPHFRHSYIGEFYTTVRKMMEGPGPSNVYSCINPKKKVTFLAPVLACNALVLRRLL